MKSKQVQEFKETEIGKISADWEVNKIENFLSNEKGAIKIGPFGSQIKREFFVADGFKVYGQENVFQNNFVIGTRFITKERFDMLSSCELKPDDLIISMMGTIGFIEIVPKNIQKGIMDSHLLRIRINKSRVDNKFLLYSLRSPVIQRQIDSFSVGTIMAGLNSKIIKQLFFPIPPLNEQKQIAKILSDLDTKIQNLQNQNKILEQIAQAIFKSWFIDFDGVTEFEDSELGKIPKGWIIQTLDSISKLTMGLSPVGSSYNTENDGVPLLNGAADFSMNSISPKKFTTKPTRICQKDDILLCVRATIGNAIFSDKKYCLGRGVGSLTPNQFHGEFLYEIINQYTKKLVRESGGSVIIGLTKPDLEKLCFAYSEKIVAEFHKTINQTFKKIRNNAAELTNIAKIRDTLLPKLMSGEIRV